jgi:long-chain acyl-CoA synthetase
VHWHTFCQQPGAWSQVCTVYLLLLLLVCLQAAVGGRLRVFLSGGAPLPKYAQDFMQIAMCVPVLQGYGLTETCAATCVQYPNKQSHVGTVGPPMPGVQVRFCR